MWDMEQAKSLVWPDWQLCEVLGRGSFGVVYKAKKEQQGVETFSAVKIIMIPQSQEDYAEATVSLAQAQAEEYLRNVVKDCVNEIRLMESLKANSNIVSIEDYKVEELVPGKQWCILIRMELLTGLTRYQETHPFAEKDIVALGSDICEALKLCKARNIIHRDIKMANIFVNEFGRFKLGDFGIARRLDEFQNAKTRLGTLHYMAPEIYQGIGYDTTIDIYSLGMVLYLLANKNRMPFLDANAEVIGAQQREEANFRRLHGEALPRPGGAREALGDVICKACAYSPADRYQTAEELQTALQAALQTDTRQCAQDGAEYRVGAAANGSGAYGPGAAAMAEIGAGNRESTGGGMPSGEYRFANDSPPDAPKPTAPGKNLAVAVFPLLYLAICNVFALLAGVFSRFNEPVVWLSYGWVYVACILAALPPLLSPGVRRCAQGEILLRITGGIYAVVSTVISFVGMCLGGGFAKPVLWAQTILTVLYVALALWQMSANARDADSERRHEQDNSVIEESLLLLETAGATLTQPQLSQRLRTVADLLKASPRKSDPSLAAVEQDMLRHAYAVKKAAETGTESDEILRALQALQTLTTQRERALRVLH